MHIEKVKQKLTVEEIKLKIEEEKKAKEDAVKRAKFIDIMEKDLRKYIDTPGWDLKRDEEIDESIPDVEVEADVPGLPEGYVEGAEDDEADDVEPASMEFNDIIARIHNARYDNDSYVDFFDEF